MIAPKRPLVALSRLTFCVYAKVANTPDVESVTERWDYEERFQADLTNDRIGPPWQQGREQGFWHRYLEGANLRDLPAAEAWRNLVPLRMGSPVQLKVGIDGARANTEALVHPWGLTLIVNVELRGALELPDLGDLAIELRTGKAFEHGTASISLDEAAALGLEAARTTFESGTAVPQPNPFSVFSLLKADGTATDFAPTADSVRRLLHAVTSFDKTWREATLPDASASKVAGRSTAPPNHTVYGRGRGRAIWSPTHFSGGGSTIGCHHRNLTFLSAQVESLTDLVSRTAEALRQGQELRAEHRTLAKRASGILGRLYLGPPTTYRSGSAKVQIAEVGRLDNLNYVRGEFDQTALPA